jgi:hypothetical protein
LEWELLLDEQLPRRCMGCLDMFLGH